MVAPSIITPSPFHLPLSTEHKLLMGVTRGLASPQAGTWYGRYQKAGGNQRRTSLAPITSQLQRP